MPKGTIILAAGGTGGHMFPAQALAESLLMKGWQVNLVTDQRGNAFANEFPRGVQKIVLNIPNPWEGGKLGFIRSLWYFIVSLIKLFRFFNRIKAESMVGFGGYPSATSIIVACILRIPIALHEQNAVLGTVNRIFQSQANLLVFGTNPMTKLERKGKTLVLGNPIRESILSVKPQDYSKIPLDTFLIFVVGGSQGANFVSSVSCNAIINLPIELKRKIRVAHQCREEDILEIEKKYLEFGVNSEIRSFFNDIPTYLNRSHLIISRAGASSLAEFCIFGRPSILIPLPSASKNHQALNAAVMRDSGASIVFNQNLITCNLLSEQISYILKNVEIANKMALAAKKNSKPEAAHMFSEELENLK